MPLEYLHTTHKAQGLLFCLLGLLHTVGHFIRWGLRGEMQRMMMKTVGISGAFAMALLLVIVTPMAWAWLKYKLPFELRISLHAGRTVELLLVGSMLAHSPRACTITFISMSVWLADVMYTHMLLLRPLALRPTSGPASSLP